MRCGLVVKIERLYTIDYNLIGLNLYPWFVLRNWYCPCGSFTTGKKKTNDIHV